MLNFDAANSGLDLIANGEIAPFDLEEMAVRVRRLIERILEQLDAQNREATESEDSYIRRSIAAYSVGLHKDAVIWAWHAATIGNTPIVGEIFVPDRSQDLRSALSEAARGVGPASASPTAGS